MSETIKRTVKGGAYFFTSKIITKGLGFIFIVLCSRYLGPVEFGIFSLGLSISGVASNLGAFGLPTTIQRFLSGEGEGNRSNNLYGGIKITFWFISIFFSGSLFFLSSYISHEIFNEPRLTIVLKVFAAGLVVNVGFQIFGAILQSKEQLKEILIGNSAQSILKIALILLAFVWIKNAFIAALVTEIASLVALLYMIKCVSKLSLQFNFPSKNDIKKVLAYALPLVFVGFSYLLSQQTDRIMLGWLSTSSDVGVYTVSSTLALVMTALHGSLVSIFMPLASKAYRNQNMKELNKAYLFIAKWVGSVNGVLSLLFAGSGMFLLNIFGTEYSTETTYQILLILTLLYFVGTLAGPTGALLQMADGHRLEMINTAIFLTLNIGLNYFFIIKFGLIGAAMGTFLSGFVRNALQVLEIRYFYNLNIINKNSIKLFIIVTGGMLLCFLISSYSFYISILFIGFVGVFIFRCITVEEKNLIINRFT